MDAELSEVPAQPGKVRVLFFSLLRDVAGCEELEVEITEGETVAMLLAGLADRFPGLGEWDSKILVAVDQDFADREAVLSDGQEVAVMPPVQGG